MILRVARRFINADVLGLLLVSIALQALTYGIASSLRNTDTQYFFWVCLLATLIAFGLSKRHGNGVLASVWLIVLGVLGIWILGARLASPLLDLGHAILTVVPQIVPSVRSQLPIDTTVIAESWIAVAQASNALSLRFQTWMMSLSGNVTVNDALIRNLIWILILWLL